MVRLGALVAAAWLAIAAACSCWPGGPRPALQWLADSLSPRLLRSLAQGAAGLSVTAGLAVPPPCRSATQDNPPGTAVMVPLDVAPTTTTTLDDDAHHRRADHDVDRHGARAPTPTPTRRRSAAGTAPCRRGGRGAPGDSFWSIAVDEAASATSSRYWRALIDANRDRLVDPSNPDLLYPDQVLRLP